MHPHNSQGYVRAQACGPFAWKGPHQGGKYGEFRGATRPPTVPPTSLSLSPGNYQDSRAQANPPASQWGARQRQAPPRVPQGPPPSGASCVWGPPHDRQTGVQGPPMPPMSSHFSSNAAGHGEPRVEGPVHPFAGSMQSKWELPTNGTDHRQSHFRQVRPIGARGEGAPGVRAPGGRGPAPQQPPPPSGRGESWAPGSGGPRFRGPFPQRAPLMWSSPLAYDSAQQQRGVCAAEEGRPPPAAPPSSPGGPPKSQYTASHFGRLVHEGGPRGSFLESGFEAPIPPQRQGSGPSPQTQAFPPPYSGQPEERGDGSSNWGPTSGGPSPASFSGTVRNNFLMGAPKPSMWAPESTVGGKAPPNRPPGPSPAFASWGRRTAAEAAAAEAAAAAVSRCIASGTVPKQKSVAPPIRASNSAEGLLSMVPGLREGPHVSHWVDRSGGPQGFPVRKGETGGFLQSSGPSRGPIPSQRGGPRGAAAEEAASQGSPGNPLSRPFAPFLFEALPQSHSASFPSSPPQQQQQQQQQQQRPSRIGEADENPFSCFLTTEAAMQLLLLAAPQQPPAGVSPPGSGGVLPSAAAVAAAATAQPPEQQRAVSEALLRGLAMGAQLQLQQQQSGSSAAANSLRVLGGPQQQLMLLESLRSAAATAAATASLRSRPEAPANDTPSHLTHASLVQLQQQLQQLQEQQHNPAVLSALLSLQQTVQAAAAAVAAAGQQQQPEQRQPEQQQPHQQQQQTQGPTILQQQHLAAALQLQQQQQQTEKSSPEVEQSPSERTSRYSRQQDQHGQQQQQQHGSGSSRNSLLSELSGVPERLLDPQENEAAHTWCYLDAFNKCQGPFSTLAMLRWLEAGYFDATRPLRRDDEKGFTPLHDGSRIKRAARDIVLSARSHRHAFFRSESAVSSSRFGPSFCSRKEGKEASEAFNSPPGTDFIDPMMWSGSAQSEPSEELLATPLSGAGNHVLSRSILFAGLVICLPGCDFAVLDGSLVSFCKARQSQRSGLRESVGILISDNGRPLMCIMPSCMQLTNETI